MVIGLIKLLVFALVCICFSQINFNCSLFFFFNGCGVFVIKYAEYFVHGKIDEMPNPLDIGKCRNQLAVDLYCYGQKQLLDGYESFSEKKPRFKRKELSSK